MESIKNIFLFINAGCAIFDILMVIIECKLYRYERENITKIIFLILAILCTVSEVKNLLNILHHNINIIKPVCCVVMGLIVGIVITIIYTMKISVRFIHTGRINTEFTFRFCKILLNLIIMLSIGFIYFICILV